MKITKENYKKVKTDCKNCYKRNKRKTNVNFHIENTVRLLTLLLKCLLIFDSVDQVKPNQCWKFFTNEW